MTERWRAGASYLMHVDSLSFMDTLPSESLDCIWTDPPYLLSNDGVTCVSGKMVTVNKGEWDRSQGLESDHAFNRLWVAKCFRLLKPSGTIWITGTAHLYFSIGMALMQEGFRILNDIVWEKPNPPPNLACRCFTHSTEMLLWATKIEKGKRNAYTFHYDAMKRENEGRQMKNVWRFAAPRSNEKQNGKHPTQKPLALIERCLRASTNPGDVVFDPFCGSGSTGVAALRLGRAFVGCELDAAYVTLAQERLTAASEVSSRE